MPSSETFCFSRNATTSVCWKCALCAMCVYQPQPSSTGWPNIRQEYLSCPEIYTLTIVWSKSNETSEVNWQKTNLVLALIAVDRLGVLFSLSSAHFHTRPHAFRQRCLMQTNTHTWLDARAASECESPPPSSTLTLPSHPYVTQHRGSAKEVRAKGEGHTRIHTNTQVKPSAPLQIHTQSLGQKWSPDWRVCQCYRTGGKYNQKWKIWQRETAMWFLTSRRRLLSLTVLPSGRLSFLGSGLEDAALLTCFLEVFSGFARKNTKTKRI